MASLISVRSSPVDTWGNVKIPWIENYENGSTADSEGWFTHDTNRATIDTYSSLTGVPISGVNDSSVNYTMNMETKYLRLECPSCTLESWCSLRLMRPHKTSKMVFPCQSRTALK